MITKMVNRRRFGRKWPWRILRYNIVQHSPGHSERKKLNNQIRTAAKQCFLNKVDTVNATAACLRQTMEEVNGWFRVIPSALYSVDQSLQVIYNLVCWVNIRLEVVLVLNQTSGHEDITRRHDMEVSSNFTSGHFTPRLEAGRGGGSFLLWMLWRRDRSLLVAANQSPIPQSSSPWSSPVLPNHYTAKHRQALRGKSGNK